MTPATLHRFAIYDKRPENVVRAARRHLDAAQVAMKEFKFKEAYEFMENVECILAELHTDLLHAEGKSS